MNLKEWTRQSRGRQASLASFLSVRAATVCEWASGQKDPSVRVAAAIEQFTQGQVTRKELFPNDWQKIWPELASATDTQTAEGQRA